MKKATSILLSIVLFTTLVLPTFNTAFGESEGNTSVIDLRTEYVDNPLGIDETKPRLGWKMKSSERGQYQTAYEIQVASSESKLLNDTPDIWDAGRVESDQSVNIVYDGEPLQTEKRYFWRVRVWDKYDEKPSEWSEPAWLEMGLLEETDWQAEWIGVNDSNNLTLDGLKWVWYPEGDPAQSAPEGDRYFRKSFNLPEDRQITEGKFLLTADDGFVLYVNGERMASSPKVTDSWKEALLVDVTSALKPGSNVFAIQAINEGSAAGLIGSMQVDFEEGESLQVNLDNNWKTAKDKQEGWEQSDFDDSDWISALEVAKYGDSPWGRNVSTPFSSASPYLRKNFSLEKSIKQARLYSTALGLYEPHINGNRVGQDIFTPGWTDYNKRIQYQTYDVTELLQNGENVIGAMVGKGWYSGHIGLVGTNVYGSKPHLLMQLKIDYKDGSSETIVTDDSWKSATGPVVSSDMLMGETYDARSELPGWNTPEFDAASWNGVEVLDEDVSGELVAQAGPTVQVTEEIKPVEITEPKPGTYIFDLGQNMVGSARLKVNGEAGKTITLRHAEVLNPDGTIYTDNLRSAKATDKYTLKGGGEEVYEPHFTFHGFRYVEVTGYSEEVTLDTITGQVMHTAAPVAGEFETSSDMLNQLQSNITWGQRGNFLSIPTDTPARDERLGWTGDINVFAGTSTFNMDVSRFLGNKWLQDLRDGQSTNGAFPDVAPAVCCGEGNAGWGDAGVTVPYTIWQRYGDSRVIKENYEAMVNWINYMKENSSGYLRPASSYGDWLDINDPTPGDLIATAYFAYSTKLLSEMAREIGKTDDAAKFENLLKDIKVAFNEAFVSDEGWLAGNSQTGHVLALYMDLLPEDKRQATADHLVELIKERDWHLSTGFLGTRDLLPVLSETGHLDVAYRLLNNDTFPSWGYQIKNGATTMWERWDSIRPDGSFQDAGMNSFNHYAYGAVGDWMYKNIAGINHDPNNPGYKHTIIRPRPGGGLTHAKGQYKSLYGTIASEWEQGDGKFKLNVTIPANSTATVYVPSESKRSVTEGGQFADEAEGITFIKMEDGNAVYEVGSGNYQFIVDSLLGNLGNALHETGEFQDEVTNLASDGQLKEDQANHLNTKSEELTDRITASIAAYFEKENDRTVKQVQGALKTTNHIQQWIEKQKKAGQISKEISQTLNDRISKIITPLSAVSTELLGIKFTLNPSKDTVLPGDTFTVEAVLKNRGKTNINDIYVDFQKPEGWKLKPISPVDKGVLKPDGTFTATFELSVPKDMAPTDKFLLAASSRYKKFGGTVEVPVETHIKIDSPITITSLKADPKTIEPGDVTMLQVVVQNKGQLPVKGRIKIDAPDNWQIEPAGQEYHLDSGEEKTVMLEARSSLNANQAGEKLLVTTMYNGHIGDKKSTTVTFSFKNPPSEYYDHVDAGEPESEQTHNLKASASSGTSVEADLTRRYTGNGVAEAYFQYDMKVEPGEPFVIRAIETYDRSQIKDYYVYVNDVKVHSRDNETNKDGSVTYQFVVDDPSLTQDGNVTVRFQEDGEGRNYDPSIADVWTMPSVAVDIPLSATGIKTLVERFEEEGEFVDEGTAHSLKIHLTAVSRYEEKGIAEKVLKHMDGFKLLLDHQQENELISKRAYQSLKANADYLIKKWQ